MLKYPSSAEILGHRAQIPIRGHPCRPQPPTFCGFYPSASRKMPPRCPLPMLVWPPVDQVMSPGFHIDLRFGLWPAPGTGCVPQNTFEPSLVPLQLYEGLPGLHAGPCNTIIHRLAQVWTPESLGAPTCEA